MSILRCVVVLVGLIGSVSGQHNRGVCNGRGRLVGGDCVCDQYYKDATSTSPAFEIVKSGDLKVYSRSPATGLLVITSIIHNSLIFTRTDDGALRVSDGPDTDQIIRGQCLLAPQPGGSIVFGSCANPYRIQDVQFLANQQPGLLRASSGAFADSCAAAQYGCSILNHGGATTGSEGNRMILFVNHGPVERVFQNQRPLDDQRCAVYDPALVSTTTTTTLVATTTQTQTTHTANFSDYHADINTLERNQQQLMRDVADLVAHVADLEAENRLLRANVTALTDGAAGISNLRHVLTESLASLPDAIPASTRNCEDGGPGCAPSIEAQGVDIVLRSPSGTVRVDTEACGVVSPCDALMALNALKRALQ